MRYTHAAIEQGDVRITDGGYVCFKQHCVAQIVPRDLPGRSWRLRYIDNWAKLKHAQALEVVALVEPHINLLNVTARLRQ